jgi:hypothetical protein
MNLEYWLFGLARKVNSLIIVIEKISIEMDQKWGIIKNTLTQLSFRHHFVVDAQYRTEEVSFGWLFGMQVEFHLDLAILFLV